MEELLLGLDIGTSSSKATLAGPDGEVLSTAEHLHGPVSMPHPGWAEQSSGAVWWDSAQRLLGQLGRPQLSRVKGVAVSGIGPCLLPLGPSAEALRPAILYGIDTRAVGEADELTRRYGAEAVLASGGSPLTSQALGPKFLWLQRHEPEVWARTRRFVMASSYMVMRLTGEYVLDHHSASQCNPLYDLDGASWRADWASDVVPGLELPRLLWPAELAGRVTPEAAAATGIPAGVPVAAGTIDAWAEALGAGVVAPGETMLAYGTTMFIINVSPGARPSSQLWLTAGVEPGSRTLAGGMATSGALTSWFRAVAGDVPYTQLVKEAAAAPPGSDGLVLVPYFAGERTPIFDPDARGCFLGLTLRHRRGHLYRALLEATGFGVRHNLEAFDAAGGTTSRLVAVGGGLRGDLWGQVVSDITGQPQQVPSTTIGASYGDAHMAAAAAGLCPLSKQWGASGREIIPNPANSSLYEELYSIYRELYPATAALAHRLTRLQQGPFMAE